MTLEKATRKAIATGGWVAKKEEHGGYIIMKPEEKYMMPQDDPEHTLPAARMERQDFFGSWEVYTEEEVRGLCSLRELSYGQ